MKKIPYGISDFKRIREQDYLYVDKTKYIEILENYSEPYIFFLRPRRFGKTLFISLLENYYDIKSQDEFNKLFQDLYIYQNKTQLVNSYYILKFNFSGINSDTKEQLLSGFTEKIIRGLQRFINYYQLDIEYDKNGMPSEIFSSFLTEVEYELNGKIYVLIDEYDHFANELLGFQPGTFKQIVSKTGFVRKWYEILKEGTESIFERIFASGVSPVTLDSLTSGFNIGSNITKDKSLNEMMGFTEKEVKRLFYSSIDKDIKFENIKPQLKKYYNGYLFSEYAETRVFNSDMALFYIKNYSRENKPPIDLVDTNIASDYGKIKKLFKLGDQQKNYEILESIINNELQEVVFTREFSLERDFTGDDFKSLLFYLGFLTISNYDKKYDTLELEVPNYVIKELYFGFFHKIIQDESKYNIELSEIKNNIKQLAKYGQIDNLIEMVEKTLDKLAFKDFRKFDEKYIKLIMITYLTLSKIYYVKSEYEVEKGYIDIALLARSGLQPEYEILIELKYIKKQDYEQKGNELLSEISNQAKKQIKQDKKADEFKERQNFLKYIVIFAGSECVEVEKVE